MTRQQSRAGFLTRILNMVAAWQRRVRDRHHLAHLSERQRCDIGLSRDVFDSEINKPFWRA